MTSACSSREDEDEEERLSCVLLWDKGELVALLCFSRATRNTDAACLRTVVHASFTNLELFILAELLGLESAAC